MSVSVRALALSLICLSTVTAPALAAVPGHGIATLSRLPKSHAMDAAPAIAALNTVPARSAVTDTFAFLNHDNTANAGAMAAAGDRQAGEPAVMAQATADSAARDAAGTAGTCEAYFTQSQALTAGLNGVFASVAAKDMAGMTRQLPALESQLAALPATEIAPEACGGNHVNAYTSYQFFELSALRAKGVDIGFPITYPIVKQPDLNQGVLAYITGWIKFEKGDFTGALSAYNKGLIMYPHNHELQNEYLATLMKLNRGADVVSYVENVLYQTYDLDDATRAKLFTARGVGLIMTGQLDAADESFTLSLLYNYSEETKGYQDQLRAARAAAKK